MIRRIIVLVALVGVIALLWVAVSGVIGFVQGIFGGGDSNKTPHSTSSPAPTSTGALGKVMCASGSVDVVPIVADAGGTDKRSFDSGINPYFGYSVTNTAGESCNIETSSGTINYIVTSGSQVIWQSKDCVHTAEYSEATLEPGKTLTSPLGDWYRVYSSSTGCGADQKPVIAGGASYHLSIELADGKYKSKDTVQFILK